MDKIRLKDLTIPSSQTLRITELKGVSVPTVIFHAKNDTTIPVPESILLAKNNAQFVELEVLADDHQSIKSLDTTWQNRISRWARTNT